MSILLALASVKHRPRPHEPRARARIRARARARTKARSCACSHRLTRLERDKLPRSAFAWPEAREYPIHNAVHVRAALGRFARFHLQIPAKFRTPVKNRILHAAHRFGIHTETHR